MVNIINYHERCTSYRQNKKTCQTVNNIVGLDILDQPSSDSFGFIEKEILFTVQNKIKVETGGTNPLCGV